MKENHESYRVNDSMVAVIGKGYGGFVALHALQKGAANCGVVVSPISDPTYLSKSDIWSYQLFAITLVIVQMYLMLKIISSTA